jgi:hypothetical protein
MVFIKPAPKKSAPKKSSGRSGGVSIIKPAPKKSAPKKSSGRSGESNKEKVTIKKLPAETYGGKGEIILGDTSKGYISRIPGYKTRQGHVGWSTGRSSNGRVSIIKSAQGKVSSSTASLKNILDRSRQKIESDLRKLPAVSKKVDAFLDRPIKEIDLRLRTLRTAQEREGVPFRGITTGAQLKRSVQLAVGRALGYGFRGVRTAKDFLFFIPSAPKAIKNQLTKIIKDPKQTGLTFISFVKTIPKAVKQEAEGFGYMLKTSPSEAVIVVGKEILILKGTGKAFKIVGKVVEKGSARLSPKFIGKIKTGQKVKIETGEGSKVQLEIVGKIPTESLKKQIKLQGKRIVATSSQQDALLGLIKRSRVVRKPIPDEGALSARAKALLKKFDEKKISGRELFELDRLIKKQSGKGILERSFFADPRGRVRPSRLGIVKDEEAGLLDLLSGDVRFTQNRPQILVFQNVKVEKLPRSLSSIKRKLRQGKALTTREANQLLLYQQKLTGKFKPVGFVTREAEVTLAPGELIRRKKKIGVALIKGRKVPIVSVKVIKPTKTTKALMAKARAGKITKKEFSSLKRRLKKETGFKLPKSYSAARKYFPVRRKITALSSRAISRKKIRPRSRVVSRAKSKPRVVSPVSGSKVYYTAKGSPYILTKSGARFIPRVGKYGRSIPRAPKRPAKVVRVMKIKFKRKKLPKKISELKEGYDVFGKSRGKLVKLNRIPLSKKDALSRGSYAIDHSTARTLTIKKAKKKVKKLGSIRKKEQRYAARSAHKLRSFRKKRGKRITLDRKLIEKRKYLIDTKGEKRGLTLARLAKREGFIRKMPKKKISTRRSFRRTIKKKKKIKPKKKRRSSGSAFFSEGFW